MPAETPQENPFNGIRDQLKELQKSVEAGKQAMADAPDEAIKQKTAQEFDVTVRNICELTAQDAKAAKDMLDAFAAANPGATLTNEKFKQDKTKLDAILGHAYEAIDGNALILGLSEGQYDLSKLQELDPTELDDEIALLSADMAWTDRAKEKFIESVDRAGMNLLGMSAKDMWNFIAGFLATYLEGNKLTRGLGWSTALKRDIAQDEARKMNIPEDVINEMTKAWEPQHRAWLKKDAATAGEEPDLLKMITEKQNGTSAPAATPEAPAQAPQEDLSNAYKEYAKTIFPNATTINIASENSIVRENGGMTVNVPMGEKGADGNFSLTQAEKELQALMPVMNLHSEITKMIPATGLNIKKLDANVMEVRAKLEGDVSLDALNNALEAARSQKTREIRMPIAGEYGFGASTPFAKIENGVLLVNKPTIDNRFAAVSLMTEIDKGAEQRKNLEWKNDAWSVTYQS